MVIRESFPLQIFPPYGNSYTGIDVSTRFLTCDQFENQLADSKTSWPVLEREARA